MQDMIATPGLAWRAMEEELRLIHDLLGGTSAMRAAGARWLPREEAESWSAWRARLGRSVLFNGLGRLVQILSGAPFRDPVKLIDTDPKLVQLFHQPASGFGSVSDFARTLLVHLLSDGIAHIQLEAHREGGLPYFIIRRAKDVIGADCDDDGHLQTIRIAEQIIVNTGTYRQAYQDRKF
ncbi:MAG: hypothetical protein ACON4G_09330 [Candidatus Puniceispirillaceae bacterium]